jgi:hypothetical protein
MRSLRFQAKGIANTCLRASAERQAADNQKKAFSYDDFEAAFAQLGWECDDTLKKRLFREVKSSIPSPANKECDVACTRAQADLALSIPFLDGCKQWRQRVFARVYTRTAEIPR